MIGRAKRKQIRTGNSRATRFCFNVLWRACGADDWSVNIRTTAIRALRSARTPCMFAVVWYSINSHSEKNKHAIKILRQVKSIPARSGKVLNSNVQTKLPVSFKISISYWHPRGLLIILYTKKKKRKHACPCYRLITNIVKILSW